VLRFGRLCKRHAFQDRELQLEMLRRFNEMPNIHFDEEVLRGKPRIDIKILKDSNTLDRFKAAVNWIAAQVTTVRH